ncbi:MAG: chloride channel protein [Desulfobulbaceae bacterium]|jgi:CIC family chloride channel protein|nr:chloride channel protein [Desulfobulbaceae bacterium]
MLDKPNRFSKYAPGEGTLTLVIAAFIGLSAGLANIMFRTVVDFFHHAVFEGGLVAMWGEEGLAIFQSGESFLFPELGFKVLLLPLIPIFGMILLIPLSYFFPGQVNGYGFTKFLRKVNLEGGRIKFRNIFLKTISTSLTIGTGGSAGVEGPIAMVGGAVGSQVGQFFRVSGDRMKVYIAAGCAGGIGAMFNAPMTGVFFASEIVLLGTYQMSSFSALVVSSALATVVSRAYYGETPAFPIPDYNIVNPLVEIPLYVGLGIIIGIVAVMHIRLFYRLRDKFDIMPVHPFIKPLIGAFIIGMVGILFPQVMGDGYFYIEQVLNDRGVLWVMFVLIFLKMAMTGVTLGSGGAGGVFAPALFIGAMVGGVYGAFFHMLMPDQVAGSGAFAAVGIGAFLGATTHSPLTAIFLLFEMTGNYKIIVPVMLASIIGTVVAKHLNHDSIDTVDFSREGIDIQEGRETSVMRSLKVGLAMQEDVAFISERANVNQLLKIFSMASDSFYFPVLAESGDKAGQMVGIISLQDVKSIIHDEELRLCATVGNICTRNVVVLTPDDSFYDAMTMFVKKGIEEIPVVESQENHWVVGMLKRTDVLTAYNREVLKRGISEKTASIPLT